jgi:AbrB family looped-hinge helix DNA binding protein
MLFCGWRGPMDTVKISPKFEIVLPEKIREDLALQTGEELEVFVLEGAIRLQRPGSITDLYGIAKGTTWKDVYRDRNDRI